MSGSSAGMIVLKSVGILALVIGGLLGIGWVFELRRRKGWAAAGFDEFLRAGAPLKHEKFTSAFTRAPFTDEEVNVTVERACFLNVTEGRITASDPAFAHDHDPFDQSLPQGCFPVDVIIGRRNDGDQRCMAVRLKFTDHPEVRLEPAWTSGAKEAAIKTKSFPSVGVDTAMAAIFSPSLSASLAEKSQELMGRLPDGNPYLSESAKDLWFCLGTESEAQAIFTYSGLGDGS